MADLHGSDGNGENASICLGRWNTKMGAFGDVRPISLYRYSDLPGGRYASRPWLANGQFNENLQFRRRIRTPRACLGNGRKPGGTASILRSARFAESWRGAMAAQTFDSSSETVPTAYLPPYQTPILGDGWLYPVFNTHASSRQNRRRSALPGVVAIFEVQGAQQPITSRASQHTFGKGDHPAAFALSGGSSPLTGTPLTSCKACA